MGQATKDSLTLLYYPATNKHLQMVRETLLQRTDIDVFINPKTAHSLTGQKTLDSYFTA